MLNEPHRQVEDAMGLLGRLEHGALRRAEKRFGHLMEPGEVFHAYESGRTVGRTRVDLVASDRALYSFNSKTKETGRIPYEMIGEVSLQHGIGKIALQDGSGFFVTPTGSPTNLWEFLQDQVGVLVESDADLVASPNSRYDGPGTARATKQELVLLTDGSELRFPWTLVIGYQEDERGLRIRIGTEDGDYEVLVPLVDAVTWREILRTVAPR